MLPLLLLLFLLLLLQPKLCSSQEWACELGREMLQLAEEEFRLALSLEGTRHSEPWIYQFMLGKIEWKQRRRYSTESILSHLLKVTILDDYHC